MLWKGNRVLIRQVDLSRQSGFGQDEDPLYWEVDLSRQTAIPVDVIPTP
jgi:hypothetical protein